VLEVHLAAMETTAAVIEDILGRWAQRWCRETVETALKGDVHRTQQLQAAGTYHQLLEEAGALADEMPHRITDDLRKSTWRHLFVDIIRHGTGGVMADVDYGIWQESGYKIPPAYEPIVLKELARVTQVLRRYGYRPVFGVMGTTHRHAAPPEAISPMETYYRLALRLPDVLADAEAVRRGPSSIATTSAWDAR
jgi:hypothetical protein